jgi:hypothetical protein
MIGVVAICCKQELLLIVVGGVFVIEAVSVDFAGPKFQTDRQTDFRHVAASSPFRTDWLERKHSHRSVLDSFDHLCVARSGDTEIEVTMRYKNQNIAVLGAGWSVYKKALFVS